MYRKDKKHLENIEQSHDPLGRNESVVIQLHQKFLFDGIIWIVELIDGRLELVKIRQKYNPSKSKWVRAEILALDYKALD